jgi:hypothetical protein
MPVLAKSCGIVIRMLIDRTFGTHLHAFYGDSELVMALNPVRAIQGDVPLWVRSWALDWARLHEDELLAVRSPRPWIQPHLDCQPACPRACAR